MKTLTNFTTSDRWNILSPIKNVLHKKSAGEVIAKESQLYPEELFTMLYHQECKRSERSKEPFLLMLIDISRLSALAPARYLLPVEEHLQNSTRGHDCKGWYRNGSVIGVIFTELMNTRETVLQKRLNDGLRTVLGHGIAGMITLSIYQISGTTKTPLHPPGSVPVVGISQENGLLYPESIPKRAIDILGATVGIALFFPLFILVALLVKTTSKGPILFSQERVGKNGKPFRMLKFRSMYTNNNDAIHREYVSKLIKGTVEGEPAAGGKKIYKMQKDPRITPIGRFIRKTSLDELPQFFNVLKGDMSIVGPRPALKYEVDQYDIWHCRRVITKPGITGFWQVEGRSLTTFDGMVRMDIRYIERSSLLFDLWLIIKTPFSLFTAKGAC